MKRTAVLGLGIAALTGVLSACAPPATGEAEAPPLASYPKLIEALHQRKRVNVLFPNPQSIFDGYHIGFVNVSAGNLTFKRRDLVVRTPTQSVEFARIYDSRIKGNDDFGPGWRLSLAEELLVRGGALAYVDRAGASHWFAKGDATYRANPMQPRHAQTRITIDEKIATLETEDGAMRTFERHGGSSRRYVLSRIETAGHRAVLFKYRSGLLASVESGGKSLFRIERNATGRVAAVRDHLGRTVRYSYTGKAVLKGVVDIAGNLWSHEHGHAGLARAVGPNGQLLLAVWYRNGRVSETRAGRRHSFKYEQGRTDVTDGAGLARSFFNTSPGITYRLVATAGAQWHMTLGPGNEVTDLQADGRTHTLRYDSLGRLEKMHVSSPSSSQGGQGWAMTFDDGRLARMASDTEGETTVAYSDRATRISAPDFTLEFVADARGVHTVMRHVLIWAPPDAKRTVTVNYDANGDVTALISGTTGVRFARNALGRIVRTRYPNGFESVYEYDQLGNRISARFSAGGSQRYAHDEAGNIVSVVSTSPGGSSSTQSYRIGEMNRVTRVTSVDGAAAMDIRYDANGSPVEFGSEHDTVRAEHGADRGPKWIRSLETGEALEIGQEIQYTLEVDRVHERRPAKREVLSRSVSEGQRYGLVAFDDSHHAVLTDLLDVYLPHYREASAILDLSSLFFSDGRYVADFERPSNPVFVAPEYGSINGCIPCLVGCSCGYASLRIPSDSVFAIGCGCFGEAIERWFDTRGTNAADESG